MITGGTRGLGLAMARAFVQEGAAVVVSSRSGASVEQAVSELTAMGGRAAGFVCDVADMVQVGKLAGFAIGTFGRFDIWVNNAGLSSPYGPTAEVPPAAFMKVIETNIIGTYNGSMVAMYHFLDRGAGKLINVLGRGSRGPTPYQNAYAPSKAWVRSFTLGLAREYKDTRVGIFAYNPGLVLTEMLTRVDVIAGHEDRLKAFPTVLRMWANPPEKVVGRVVWLAGPATDGRTGFETGELSPLRIVAGAAREGIRRLLRQPGTEIEIKVTAVPPAFSVKRHTAASSGQEEGFLPV